MCCAWNLETPATSLARRLLRMLSESKLVVHDSLVYIKAAH